jgi:hypothetical protein
MCLPFPADKAAWTPEREICISSGLMPSPCPTRLNEAESSDYSWAIVKYLTDAYYTQVARYMTSAFLRMKLGEALGMRVLSPRIFETPREAIEAAKPWSPGTRHGSWGGLSAAKLATVAPRSVRQPITVKSRKRANPHSRRFARHLPMTATASRQPLPGDKNRA